MCFLHREVVENQQPVIFVFFTHAFLSLTNFERGSAARGGSRRRVAAEAAGCVAGLLTAALGSRAAD